MAFIDEIERYEEYIKESQVLKEKIQEIAKNKNIEILYGEDTMTTLLDKINEQQPEEDNSVEFDTTFGNNTPEVISAVSEIIATNNMTSEDVYNTYGWSVGDTHDITLTSGETIQVRIIGFNHDDKSDGSGKAGITLQMVDCLATKYKMNDTSTNAGGYPASVMKTSTLPTIRALLPQEWQDVTKLVDKKSANGGSTNYTATLTTSEDLFLLSAKEVYGVGSISQDGENEGSVYEYWSGKDDAYKIKKYDTDADGVADTATDWWLRSCSTSKTTYFRNVSSSGGYFVANANIAYGVSFGFCI